MDRFDRQPIALAIQGVHSTSQLDSVLYGECLARTTSAGGAVRSYGDRIARMEQTGGIVDFDLHMLKMVLNELQAEPEAVLGLNISAVSLSDAVTRARFLKSMSLRSHLASRLVLEITETSPLRDLAAVKSFLCEVKSYGCRIALDDFGTGYATPAQLLALNLDMVKIDASFVRQVLARDGLAGDSLYYLVGLAACSAPIVIAEGIETREHFSKAVNAGATHLQGYFASRPLLSKHSPACFR